MGKIITLLIFISILIVIILNFDTLTDKYLEFKYGKSSTLDIDNYTISHENINDIPEEDLEVYNVYTAEERKADKEHTRKFLNHIKKMKRVKRRPIKKQTSHYRCDGRTWCSQMHSCQEATFFSHNCSSTMDGDGDGIPCESQWCH